MAKNFIKFSGGASEITANVASAVASRSPKGAFSTLTDVINFYRTGKGVYIAQLVDFQKVKFFRSSK